MKFKTRAREKYRSRVWRRHSLCSLYAKTFKFKFKFLKLLIKYNYNLKMFLTRSEYDRGVNTFSPEGRLFQVRMNSLFDKFGVCKHNHKYFYKFINLKFLIKYSKKLSVIF